VHKQCLAEVGASMKITWKKYSESVNFIAPVATHAQTLTHVLVI